MQQPQRAINGDEGRLARRHSSLLCEKQTKDITELSAPFVPLKHRKYSPRFPGGRRRIPTAREECVITSSSGITNIIHREDNSEASVLVGSPAIRWISRGISPAVTLTRQLRLEGKGQRTGGDPSGPKFDSYASSGRRRRDGGRRAAASLEHVDRGVSRAGVYAICLVLG